MTSDGRPKGFRLLASLLTVLLAAPGCGKKGEPSPPLPQGPNAVKDLVVEQEGGEAVLTFSYPDRLLDGRPLTDLDAIEIYRLAGATPSPAQPSQASAGAGSGALDKAPGGAARRAALSVRMAEQGFYRYAAPVARLPVAELARRTRGATIVYRDDLLPLFQKERVSSEGYAVVSVRRTRDRSPLSNIAIITPEIPPGPPEILALTAEEGRVCLEWLPPEHDMAGKPARIGGYNGLSPVALRRRVRRASDLFSMAWHVLHGPGGALRRSDCLHRAGDTAGKTAHRRAAGSRGGPRLPRHLPAACAPAPRRAFREARSSGSSGTRSALRIWRATSSFAPRATGPPCA